jgi:hypothetical protein
MPIKIVREKKSIDRGGTSGIERKRQTIANKNAPDFDTMFEDGDSPMDAVSLTGELEPDMNNQLSATLIAINKAKALHAEKFRIAYDYQYYFVVCFQCVDQRDEFLKKIGWDDLLDDMFLNGLEVARRLKVDIKPIEIPPTKLRGNGKQKKFASHETL